MFQELNNLLNISQTDELRGKIVALSDSSADGSFLIHHFLLHFLKNEKPVCFVALVQSFGHYNGVATKCGIPLTACRQKGILCFIDGLDLIRNNLNSEEDSNPLSLTNTDKSLKTLADMITSSYDNLEQKTAKTPVIMIDNLSVLIDIGHSVSTVTSLSNSLSEHVLQTSSGPSKCALITFVNNGDHVNDDDKEVLWKYLCHSADLTVEVSGLQSGYCKEVHGKVKATWKDSLFMQKSETRQFKLSEKNVSLFASGMSSAVI